MNLLEKIMVKKIRLVDSEKAVVSEEKKPKAKKTIVSTKEETQVKTNDDLIELLKSMDWKLWELLQIGQRLEKLFIKDDTTEDS